ncbi:MAG: hypothetical protein HY236_09810, partial [Acidobacteria bacterium]|nr:hypothetical protein [Acidobacteriota bacterium]
MPRRIVLLFFSAVLLQAQGTGVMEDWQVREMAVALEKHSRAVDALLAQLKPEEWAAQGSPELYVEQLKQTRQFNTYLTQRAQALAETPAKLSVAL